MRGLRSWRGRAAAMAAAAAIVAVAGTTAADAAGIKRGGTLTIARPDEPLTFDPFIPSDNGSIYAIAQVCEPLISADETGKGLVPGLAESWDISPDLLTYTFPLLMQLEGTAGIFLTYGVICLAGFIFVAVFVPETKGRTLEEISAGVTRV